MSNENNNTQESEQPTLQEAPQESTQQPPEKPEEKAKKKEGTFAKAIAEIKARKGGEKKPKKTPPKKPTATPPASKQQFTVPLKDIVLSEFWNREKLGDISDLVASIKERGQLYPLMIYAAPNQKNKYLLVMGRRRYAALQKLGIPTALVAWWDPKTSDLPLETAMVLDSLIENVTRRDNTAHEKALVYQKLADSGLTNDQIARACGMTSGHVSQHRSLINAPKKLQTAIKNDKVALHVLRPLNQLDPEADAALYNKMVDEAIEGTPVSTIAEKIDTYLEKKREKETAKALKSGKAKPKDAPKRGAAAHKKKQAQLEFTDYAAPETKKQLTKVSLQENIKFAVAHAEMLKRATRKEKRAYYQGVIDGCEFNMGLITYES